MCNDYFNRKLFELFGMLGKKLMGSEHIIFLGENSI